MFWEQPDVADSILTPTQRTLLPILVNLLGVPNGSREHARFIFGNPVTLVDKPSVVRGPR